MDIHELLHNFNYRFLEHLSSRIRLYRIEIFLISVAFCIASVSLLMSRFQDSSVHSQVPATQELSLQNKQKQTPSQLLPPLAVDISGAVNNPDVYYASPGARLTDIIKMAGGLSYEADISFVERNFNMSTYVFDQEKIYVPSIWDISQGIFVEEPKLLEYLEPHPIETNQYDTHRLRNPTNSRTSTPTLSLNTASKDELDLLPGIGPVTAQKIIDNRPYENVDELLSKKVINTSLWAKIQEFVSP